MNKQQFWPKEGKLKKGLIILAIVIVASLAAVLLEEKTKIKLSQRSFYLVSFLCVGIWLYQPKTTEDKTVK
jgi:hypothetical protein